MLTDRRINRPHVPGHIHLLLWHAATSDTAQGHRTQQVEIQVRLTTIGDRVVVGDLGGLGDLSNV